MIQNVRSALSVYLEGRRVFEELMCKWGFKTGRFIGLSVRLFGGIVFFLFAEYWLTIVVRKAGL